MFDIPFGNEEIEGIGPTSTIPYLPLYLSGKGDHCVIVDLKHFMWASQWKWSAKPSKNGKKIYACRSGSFSGRSVSVFLHKEICFRKWGMPPTPSHIIADHDNGKSLDCREDNLHWATPSMNRQNYHGIYAMQLRLAFKEYSDVRLRRFQVRKHK